MRIGAMQNCNFFKLKTLFQSRIYIFENLVQRISFISFGSVVFFDEIQLYISAFFMIRFLIISFQIKLLVIFSRQISRNFLVKFIVELNDVFKTTPVFRQILNIDIE